MRAGAYLGPIQPAFGHDYRTPGNPAAITVVLQDHRRPDRFPGTGHYAEPRGLEDLLEGNA